jgi:hypothetical protein
VEWHSLPLRKWALNDEHRLEAKLRGLCVERLTDS